MHKISNTSSMKQKFCNGMILCLEFLSGTQVIILLPNFLLPDNLREFEKHRVWPTPPSNEFLKGQSHQFLRFFLLNSSYDKHFKIAADFIESRKCGHKKVSESRNFVRKSAKKCSTPAAFKRTDLII